MSIDISADDVLPAAASLAAVSRITGEKFIIYQASG